MLGIASALTGATRLVQCAAVVTCSRALAARFGPSLQWMAPRHPAIAVLDRFLECHCCLMVFEVYIGQEVGYRHEGVAISTAARTQVASLEPILERFSWDTFLAYSVLECRIAAQGGTNRLLRPRGTCTVVTPRSILAQIGSWILDACERRNPTELLA